MLAAAAALPLSIRATWADMRWAAPPSTSSASRPRAASEASWASSALAWPWALRPGFLHRLGDRARLLLGARQIVEEDSDIDLGGRRGGVERGRLLVERRGLLGEIIGHPAEPVGGLVAQRHQPLGLAAQPGVILLDPAGDDLEHALQRPALGASSPRPRG